METTNTAKHFHYACSDMRRDVKGAHDMLKEAAKQFRSKGDEGHATMCELHQKSLAFYLTETEKLDV